MPKFRLIRDLPFQKADDTEWEKNLAIFIDSKDDNHRFIWDEDWGNPLKSGWFEEVKQKKWRAERGESYYCIDDDMLVFESKETGLSIDDVRFESNNYFGTLEQAQEAAKRIKKLLAEYQEEINKE